MRRLRNTNSRTATRQNVWRVWFGAGRLDTLPGIKRALRAYTLRANVPARAIDAQHISAYHAAHKDPVLARTITRSLLLARQTYDIQRAVRSFRALYFGA